MSLLQKSARHASAKGGTALASVYRYTERETWYLINDLKVNNFIMGTCTLNVDAYLKKDLCRCRADGNSNSVANLK